MEKKLSIQKGNALLSVLIAGAVLMILLLASSGFIKMMLTQLAASEDGFDINNQIYIAKIQLSDPATCLLNMQKQSITIPSGRIRIPQPFYEKNLAAGILSTTHFIFPQGPTTRTRVSDMSLERHPTVPQVADLILNFERRGTASSLVRKLPLFITTDATGKITSCTAGDMGSQSPTPTPTPAPAGSLANCDKNFSEDPIAKAFYAQAKDLVKQICQKLTYPTSVSPQTMPTLYFVPSGGCESASCPPLTPREYGVGNGILQAGFHFQTLPNGGVTTGVGFNNLSSASECIDKVPAIPDGGGFSTDPTNLAVSGGYIFNCRGGTLWRNYYAPPVSEPNPGGASPGT